MLRLVTILSLFCIFLQLEVFAQETQEEPAFISSVDTTSIVKRHSPKKAAVLSAILPGMGQIYNKKYWKLPIVYGGLAGLGAWVGINSRNLKGYTNAYKLELDDDPNTVGSYKGISGSTNLSIKRDDSKRSLDLSIILLSVFYAFNIIDATVDAHLFDYSITDDLSVKLQPDFNLYQAQEQVRPKVGVNFTMYFHQKN